MSDVQDVGKGFTTMTNNKSAKATGRLMLYASVGAELVHYDVDVDNAALIRRGSVRLDASVMYVCPHASKRYLYVVTSNRGLWPNKGAPGDTHQVVALRIDPETGALHTHGAPVALRNRSLHITTDARSEHVLIACNEPSELIVHRINGDGTVGDEVKQSALDTGIYAHQVRVSPSNDAAILVTRGNDAHGAKAEDPGALKVFSFRNGRLGDGVSIAPGNGYGFGPRHLDFHPSQPWVYVSLERQHKICLFTLNGSTLSSLPLFSVDTLSDTKNIRPRQMAGTVHVHPNGRFLYGCERADATTEVDGRQVFAGGENSISVYAIDQVSGELVPVQHINTRGFHARTFSFDPGGRILVAACKSPVVVQEGNATRTVSASLDVFRMGVDGRLEYIRKYDIDVGNASLYWSGLLQL